jgi:Tetracyclin repressor-like, C-terminal domain
VLGEPVRVGPDCLDDVDEHVVGAATITWRWPNGSSRSGSTTRTPAARNRAALTDAAIRVLGRAGARGLTYRSVEVEAEVPSGTSLRAPLTATVRADLAANFAFHRAAGLPGDTGDLLLLHLALTGLLLEQLTLPDTLGGADADALIAELVGRLVPAAEPRPVAGGSARSGTELLRS